MKPDINKEDERIKDFNNLLQNLKDSEYLECSFGRDSYRISKFEDKFKIETKGHMFTSRYKEVLTFSCIEAVLNYHPEFYAANVHTGQIIFLSNWPNFLAAFRLKENKKDD